MSPNPGLFRKQSGQHSCGVQALKPAHIQPGQRVLIHAGSGGVGTAAIQLAKMWDAYVVTTASATNEKFLKVLYFGKSLDAVPVPSFVGIHIKHVHCI